MEISVFLHLKCQRCEIKSIGEDPLNGVMIEVEERKGAHYGYNLWNKEQSFPHWHFFFPH